MDYRGVVLSFALRLYDAVEDNNFHDVKDLVQRKGANPNIVLPNHGISSFHLAVGIDSVTFSKEITKLFLRYGGNPNIRSCEGLTPVHVASIWGRLENLRLLLLAGGDLQALDDDGRSPLFYAHKEGHIACVELLQNYQCIYSQHFSPTSVPHCTNETEIYSKKSDDFTGLLLKNNYNKQVYDCSEVFAVDEMNLNMPENLNLNAIGQPHENIVKQEKLNDMCLKSVYPGLVFDENKDNSQNKKSVNLPTDLSGFTLATNRSWASFPKSLIQIECEKFESWLASKSCFPETSALENGYREDLRSNEEIEIGENNVNVPLKVNDETFTKNSSSSSSLSNTHLIYDISDWMSSSSETLLTYDIYKNSILTSDRSSPIQNESNILIKNHDSQDISDEFKSYAESKMSVISSSIREKPKFVAYRKKGWLNINFVESSISSTSCPESEDYYTVPEELYQYTDEEEGVILLEKRLLPPVHPGMVTTSNAQNKEFLKEDSVRRTSSAGSLSSCNTEDLRKELYKAVSFGCCCPLGPITATTKRVYLRKIDKFKKAMKNKSNQSPLQPVAVNPKFSRELELTLANPLSLDHRRYYEIEQRMIAQFDQNGKFSQWREGCQKSSFNYLLLDPRVTCNLPLRWANDAIVNKGFNSDADNCYWRDFLCSIFYVGKGKRSRPYSHLYEAVNAWRNKATTENKLTKKVKHILEIWKENSGVVCLHVFQNVIPAEAFTREAAMIDAIGLNNLKNERRGDYYGVISSLGFSQKRHFGSFLLHRAMLIFLNEGERQMRPADID